MTVNYIEKARANRIAALASVKERAQNVVTIFDEAAPAMDLAEEHEVLQFISRRPGEGDRIAA